MAGGQPTPRFRHVSEVALVPAELQAVHARGTVRCHAGSGGRGMSPRARTGVDQVTRLTAAASCRSPRAVLERPPLLGRHQAPRWSPSPSEGRAAPRARTLHASSPTADGSRFRSRQAPARGSTGRWRATVCTCWASPAASRRGRPRPPSRADLRRVRRAACIPPADGVRETIAAAARGRPRTIMLTGDQRAPPRGRAPHRPRQRRLGRGLDGRQVESLTDRS